MPWEGHHFSQAGIKAQGLQEVGIEFLNAAGRSEGSMNQDERSHNEAANAARTRRSEPLQWFLKVRLPARALVIAAVSQIRR